MADNTTLNPGTGGDVIAGDDIGGVKFQRCKLIHGADGSNCGDVAVNNPFPTAFHDRTVSFSLNANDETEEIELNGSTSVCIYADFSSATLILVLEGTADNTNWYVLNLSSFTTGTGYVTNNIYSSGIYFPVALFGLQKVRVRATSYSSGPVTGIIRVTSQNSSVPIVAIDGNCTNSGAFNVGDIGSYAIRTMVVSGSISANVNVTNTVTVTGTVDINNINMTAVPVSLSTPLDVRITPNSAIGTGQVSVTDSATLIYMDSRDTLTIVNHGTTDVYIGDSGVTTTTGVLLPGIKGAALTLNSNVQMYGIVASGSQTVSYISEYNI